MNFGAGFPVFGSISDEKCNHCIVTATVTGFSNCDNCAEAEVTEYYTSDEDFKVFFLPKFYANGSCNENKGYVSILFYGGDILSYIIYFSYIEFNCTIGVIDVAGSKRFLQSFAYVYDPNSPCGLENNVPKFGLSKYIKRDTLLSEPFELLPDDCLTIYMEVDYLIRVLSLDFSPCIINDTFVEEGDKYYICLDSAFGRDLCKACNYFQRVSDTPMIENQTRRAYVPSEELKAFQHIHLIITKADVLKIESMTDICQLYVIADKYDIQPVIETCRDLVKSFLSAISDSEVLEHAVESIPMVLELAEKYRDESLNEIITLYLEIKEKCESSEYSLQAQLKTKLMTEWICEFEKIEDSAYFKLKRIQSCKEEHKMEFYT